MTCFTLDAGALESSGDDTASAISGSAPAEQANI